MSNMDFDALRIRLASPDEIRAMSHGEVTKSETVNYRTNRPEPGGLFCERIFGPTRDYECACGKYKGRKYEGIVCERCGVEVTRSSVRRERMGHIELGTPVVHPWFFRNAQSRLGFMLDMKEKDLERIVYYTSDVAVDAGPDMLPRLTLLSQKDAVFFALWVNGQRLVFHSVAEANSIPIDRIDLAGSPEFGTGIFLLESVLADIYGILSENIRTYSSLSNYKIARHFIKELNERIAQSYDVSHDVVERVWKGTAYVLFAEGGARLITSEEFLMLLPVEQEMALAGVKGITALVAADEELLEYVAGELQKFPRDARRIDANPVVRARQFDKAAFIQAIKSPVFCEGAWLSFEEALEKYQGKINSPLSGYLTHVVEEVLSSYGIRKNELLNRGAKAVDSAEKQYLLGKATASVLETPDYESVINRLVSGSYVIVPELVVRAVDRPGYNRYRAMAKALSLALHNLVIRMQRVKEVLDQRNLPWEQQRVFVEEDVRFILKALGLDELDVSKVLDGGYEVVDNFGYFSANPREGENVEDVLRNAMSMVVKEMMRLIDRVQDFETLIEDDKDRVLQVINHVLGVSLADGQDLEVADYKLRLVKSLRPLSQEQVWQSFTLLVGQALIADEVLAAEASRLVGADLGQALHSRLDMPVVATSFVRPRVNCLDLLSEQEAETYRQLVDVDRLRNEEPLLKSATGGEAIKQILVNNYSPDKLEDWVSYLVEQLDTGIYQKKQKVTKRLQVVNGFVRSKSDPAWMVMEVLPVLPPELRPLIFDKSERAKSSDLNELYRRIINRNLRLKRLREQKAPELIVRNEMRLLQEAVGALIDNGRKERPVKDSRGRQLKSLTDKLSGKQGRFRQNLLGKRVDYSGRSVIVIGPTLKLNQAGIPRIMAAELFKPMLIGELQKRELATTAKQAKKMIENHDPRIWPVLAEIVKGHYVLLNRAPTLHRPSIQAFEPVLVDSKAISIPPMVCPPFNADFDGDQMAVHVPLSNQALSEARFLMSSHLNVLSPAHGEPLAAPTQDLVIGPYYLTVDLTRPVKGDGTVFWTPDEVVRAFEEGKVDIHAHIWYVPIMKQYPYDSSKKGNTTVGRVVFNDFINRRLESHGVQLLPFANETMTKKALYNFINEAIDRLGLSDSIYVLDAIKELGFKFATLSGLSISALDLKVVPVKHELVLQARKKVEQIERDYEYGKLTAEERYEKVVEIWRDVVDKVTNSLTNYFNEDDHLYMMFTSGARGNKDQVRQLVGLRGLMADPTGRIIEYPIVDSLLEGLTIQEYFVSTHGARKGQADTALKTADAGYLTRRLVDVVQSITISEDDHEVVAVSPEKYDDVQVALAGRIADEDVKLPGLEEPIVKKGQVIGLVEARLIAESGVEVMVRRNIELVKLERLIDPDDFVYGLNHVKWSLPGDLVVGDEVIPNGTPVTPSMVNRLLSLGVRELVLRRQEGLLVKDLESTDGSVIATLGSRIWGRFAAEDVIDPATGEVLVRAGQEITTTDAKRIEEAGIKSLRIHSAITCLSDNGVCVTCYGRDLSRRRLVEKGEAVGIVAAQSIGEPGTQLTLRTFHTGGVAGEDITGGLPRVEELFEARKKNALTELVLPLQDFYAVLNGSQEKIKNYVSGAMESFVKELDNVIRAHVKNADTEMLEGTRKVKLFVKEWFEGLAGVMNDALQDIRNQLLATFDWDGLDYAALTMLRSRTDALFEQLAGHARDFENRFAEVLHYADLEDHVGGLRGHFREKLDAVLSDLRAELSIVPWYLAASVGIRGQDPVQLKEAFMSFSEELKAEKLDFAFDVNVKHPSKKSRLIAMAPVAGVVRDVFTIEDRGAELFTVILVDNGNGYSAFITNSEARRLRIRREDIGKKYIFPGYRLVFDSLDASVILRAFGKDAAADYLIGEIKSVYASQKVEINDKHFEIVLKQMFSKVGIEDSGDSLNMLPGDVVDVSDFEQEVRYLTLQGKRPPQGRLLAMGISKVSKLSKSWLAAASFQETPQVLVDAAIEGKVDKLKGLKENVIIARRIPAGTGIYKEDSFIIE
ncbi:RNA polymerase subunit beta [Coprothermobacteraceae bacterium]|nr:RNA polymerase subunit beta [Coprothermobacteraceae bacterium]